MESYATKNRSTGTDRALGDDLGAISRFRGANIVDAGEHNKNLVLQEIRAGGPMTRIEISSRVQLTPPTVFKITNELAASELIVKAGKTSGERGKPASSWTINSDAAFSLGFAIDRDHLTLVLLDFSGKIRTKFHKEVAFPTPSVAKAFFQQCASQLLRSAPTAMTKLVGVGIAIPDEMDKTKLPDQPQAFREWSNVAPASLVGDDFNLPACVENDAAAAAIGEQYFGGGLKSDTFFYILISAGLGGGLVINRHYYRGARGRSGEIGYLPLVNPFKSRLTNLQCRVGDGVLLADLYHMLQSQGIEARTPIDLVELNVTGQACVDAWITKVADILFLPILGVLCCIDPDAIYVGGRLPWNILDKLCHEVSKRVSLNVGVEWPELAVRPAQLAEDASAIGAAVLSFRGFWNQKNNQTSRITFDPHVRYFKNEEFAAKG